MIFMLKNCVFYRTNGETAVDRGFYINISALKTSPECVIAKRLVKNHLLENNLKPHTIQITNATVRAFKGARQSYATYLDDENKKKIQTRKSSAYYLRTN